MQVAYITIIISVYVCDDVTIYLTHLKFSHVGDIGWLRERETEREREKERERGGGGGDWVTVQEDFKGRVVITVIHYIV